MQCACSLPHEATTAETTQPTCSTPDYTTCGRLTHRDSITRALRFRFITRIVLHTIIVVVIDIDVAVVVRRAMWLFG